LHEFSSLNECAQALSLEETECHAVWQQARKKLYAHRVTRIAPGRDDKILTSWNALMIKGMLIASRIFSNQDYFTSAQRALEFIATDMRKDRRLFATYKDGKAHLNAYLDDYAFLLDAILEYLQTHWDSEYLLFAIEMADVLLDQFEDREHGGFYFTANDHESLIQRPKVTSDEATPAGNGIAAYALLRLGYLLSEPKYIQAAERTVEYASQQISSTPMAHASLLRSCEEINTPPATIIIRGDQDLIKQWQQACQQQYNPQRMTFAIPSDATKLPEALENKCANSEEALAYICQGMSCLGPAKTLKGLNKALGKQ
jgi:uncharacterized protein YyaL (SSP411 family)